MITRNDKIRLAFPKNNRKINSDSAIRTIGKTQLKG